LIVTTCASSHIPQKSICDQQTRSKVPSPPHRSPPPARPTIIDARSRACNTLQYVHLPFTHSLIVCLRSPFLHVSPAHGMRATLPLAASRDAVWLLATKTRHTYRYCEQRCARAEPRSAHFLSLSISLWFTQHQCDITLPSSYSPTEFTQSPLLTCKKKRSQTGPRPDTSLVPSLCPPSTAKRLVTTATFTEHGCRAHGSLDGRPDHGDPVAYWIRDFALDTSGSARSTAIATAALQKSVETAAIAFPLAAADGISELLDTGGDYRGR